MKYSSLKMEIEGYADGTWPKLINAEEVQSITGVDKETLLQYAKSGCCPHVLVAHKEIFFIRSHVVRWIRENLLHVCDGTEIAPVPILVKEPCQWAVPQSLALVADRLIEVPEISGIYFLVLGGEVVYVGQSCNVATRILNHKNKTYDRALVLPCPRSKLNEIEAAFIGFFKPALNMNQEETKFIHNHRDAFENPSIVLNSLINKSHAQD